MEKDIMEELNGHWHLRREVSVGHLVSTILLALLVVGGWAKLQSQHDAFIAHMDAPSHPNADRRMDLMEIEIARTQEFDLAMAARFEQLQTDIIRRLDRIEDRLNEHDGK